MSDAATTVHRVASGRWRRRSAAVANLANVAESWGLSDLAGEARALSPNDPDSAVVNLAERILAARGNP